VLSIQVQLLIFPKITTLPWQTVRAAFTHRFHRGPVLSWFTSLDSHSNEYT